MVDKQLQVNNEMSQTYRIIKRVFDVCFSSLAIVLLAPVGLVIALLIKLDSRGSVFYVHERMGKNFTTFKMYKFRTMRSDAGQMMDVFTEQQKEEWRKNFKVANDPRTTRMGKILRSTSLDELPQFWNVLKGDMSLIGPRPIIRQELLQYGNNQAKLLSVLPGITGYWQAYARNECGYPQRIDMELYYVDHAGFALDIRIFFATIGRILSRKGAA